MMLIEERRTRRGLHLEKPLVVTSGERCTTRNTGLSVGFINKYLNSIYMLCVFSGNENFDKNLHLERNVDDATDFEDETMRKPKQMFDHDCFFHASFERFKGVTDTIRFADCMLHEDGRAYLKLVSPLVTEGSVSVVACSEHVNAQSPSKMGHFFNCRGKKNLFSLNF